MHNPTYPNKVDLSFFNDYLEYFFGKIMEMKRHLNSNFHFFTLKKLWALNSYIGLLNIYLGGEGERPERAKHKIFMQ